MIFLQQNQRFSQFFTEGGFKYSWIDFKSLESFYKNSVDIQTSSYVFIEVRILTYSHDVPSMLTNAFDCQALVEQASLNFTYLHSLLISFILLLIFLENCNHCVSLLSVFLLRYYFTHIFSANFTEWPVDGAQLSVAEVLCWDIYKPWVVSETI